MSSQAPAAGETEPGAAGGAVSVASGRAMLCWGVRAVLGVGASGENGHLGHGGAEAAWEAPQKSPRLAMRRGRLRGSGAG